MIKKVAVIGAGVMGSGIAAQIANNNIEVLLFDLENESGLIASAAIQKQLASKSSQFIHSSVAARVSPMSLTSDLGKIVECDLVIEAIIENISLKRQLYNNLSPYLKQGSIIASNTSTFRLSQLIENLDYHLRSKICICHFFNPPRYMRLLEFVAGEMGLEQKKILIDFLSNKLGKDVIEAKDTPGFIANRLGCYLMELVFHEALSSNLAIEEIDTAFTQYFGFPSTGIFALFDLIGLDVMHYIKKSLLSSLDKNDLFHELAEDNPHYATLLQDGYTGRKGKGGFFKQEKDAFGKKLKFSLDLHNFQYRPYCAANLAPQDAKAFLTSDSELSKFCAKILAKFASYTIMNASAISYDMNDIDRALKLGFAWKYGPFELAQKFDILPKEHKSEILAIKLDIDRINIKPHSLANVRQLPISALMALRDCNLWRINSNKICFEITSKMNILTSEIFSALIKSCQIAEETASDLIIYSDAPHFSVGADLQAFYQFILQDDRVGLRKYLSLGQQAMMALKYCKSPVIACARGAALGGGAEILLHSSHIIAHQDLQAGLVESTLGLIPGWGGVKEMMIRSQPNDNILLVYSAYKSHSALDFSLNYKQDHITYIASANTIFEYALNNNFSKKQHNLKAEYDFSDFNQTNYAWPDEINNIFIKKIQSCKSEQDLLLCEREMFELLVFSSATKKKIEEFLGIIAK